MALLLVMSGGTLDAASSLGEDVTVPQGLNSVVEDVLTPSGILSSPSDASRTEIHVNRFYVDYDESGEVCTFNLRELTNYSFPFHKLLNNSSRRFFFSVVYNMYCRFHSSILIFLCLTLMERKY